MDFGNMSVINLKNDEITDEDSLENMILLLNEKKEKRINSKQKNYGDKNIIKVENKQKLNNLLNIKSKINNLSNQRYLNDIHNNNLNLFIKEEEAKTKANTCDKNFSIKMDSIKSETNENEKIKSLSNNDMNIKDVYYKYNDDYKINYDNSDDKFDSDKFNNNFNYKTFEDNYNKNIKLLGKKREKVEKEDKISNKTMNNENIFYDINKLYNNYNGKEKIYKLYENNKGFFDKNITVVEANIPICIIYFNHEIITKIYMIIEQITFDKEEEILCILIKIKKNIQKKLFELNEFKKYNS